MLPTFISLSPTLIAIIAAGLVIIISLFLILYFTFFTHMLIKRQAKEICGRFEREHALLFGQDSQYIKRLETISSMNLIYVQPYLDWSKKFKDVRDVSDASAQAAVNSVKDLLNARRFKELKAFLPSAKKTIEEYEKQVDSLDSNLRSKFKDEEDCRNLALSEKEKFRKVKQDYYAEQNDLQLLTATFDLLFRKVENLFSESEQDIENARYADAKDILNQQIDPVVTQVSSVLKVLPNICLEISSIIPDKIASLSNRYDEMTSKGYPLNHILVKSDITAMNNELSAILSRVKTLNLAGVSEELDSMTKGIEDDNVAFDKEKAAREVFEKDCENIYVSENDLENSFISLCHALPKVRQIYLLGADDQTQIDKIQNTINKAGASKRSLDAYVHSSTKQPFSILVEKMKTLKGQAEEGSDSILSFQNYLSSLKNDSDEAAKSLADYYRRLREAEKMLNDIHITSIDEKYRPILNQLYALVDILHSDLKTLPIDVKKVNEDLDSLQKSGDSFLSDVSSAKENMISAEKEIVYANRHRQSSSQINTALLQAESLFYAGNFKDSYRLAANAIKDIKESD